MNKIVIRTVTQGYIVETPGVGELFPLEYAAETVEKVKEIIHLLLSAEENKNMLRVEYIADSELYDVDAGCKHEWEASANSASGYKCKLCNAFRAY